MTTWTNYINRLPKQSHNTITRIKETNQHVYDNFNDNGMQNSKQRRTSRTKEKK
jgi:hypothetical protein